MEKRFSRCVVVKYVFIAMLLCGAPFSALCSGVEVPSVTKNCSSIVRDARSGKWVWDTLDYQKPQDFPYYFMWGTATSAHQVEGNCTHNSWSAWEKLFDDAGKPRVQCSSGLACDHWNRYKQDIELMKQLGVNAYRFSVEWSKIEPEEGVFNEDALQHYEDVCLQLLMQGIRPCITLHHYTDPLWFLEKYGFEKEENIAYYVRFATTVIKRLHRFNPLWFTFNSPDGYAGQGYLTCTKPAGRLRPLRSTKLFAMVYKNLLQAHVQTYRCIKADPDYKDAQIGILKNMFKIEPYNSYAFWDVLPCCISSTMTDTPFFDFFRRGIFKIGIPCFVRYRNAQAIGALDFIGINYYSHGCMKNFRITTYADEVPTDNPRYTLYPEGLYYAIKEVSEKLARPLSIPMYITENGIATMNEDLRQLFLQQYLYALSRAVHDGYDVRGYFFWAFMDNYEWGSYMPKYGLYAVDFVTQQRVLKPGSKFYVDTIGKNRSIGQ